MNQIDIGNDKNYKDTTQEYLDDEINRISETIIDKIENISNVNRNYYSNKNNETDSYSEEKEYKAFENDINDIVFGETVSGRNIDTEGIENAVGMFINTIPVRIRPESTPNLRAEK